MMMNGGIDRIVEQKADANRGNPQRLEQSYARNKELLDLLALQKLKSEKDAAARDLEMKAQQQPGTIAEQLEQEMLTQTKNEMVEQTAGIMEQRKQKAAEQAKRMGQPTPPPQGTGILGMAPPKMGQRPMPGFFKGGPIDDDPSLKDLLSSKALARIDVDTIKQAIQAGDLKKADFDAVLANLPAGKNKDEIVEYLMKSHDHTPGIRAVVDSGDPRDTRADTSKPFGVFSQTTIGTPRAKDDLISDAEKELEGAKPGTAEYDRASDKLAVLRGGTGSMSPDRTRRLEQEIERLERQRRTIEGNFPGGRPREKGAAIQREIDSIKKYLGQDVDPNLYYGIGSAAGPKPDSPFRTQTATGVPATGITEEENAEIDAQIAAQMGGTQAGPQAGSQAAPTGIATVPTVTELDASKMIDTSGISKTGVSDAMGEDYMSEIAKMQGLDPRAEQIAEEKRQDLRFDRAGKTKRMEDLASGYDKLQMTPEERAFEEKMAGIRGAGIGGAGGYAQGVAAQRRINRQQAREDYETKASLTKEAIAMDADLIAKANVPAAQVYQTLAADRRAAFDIAQKLGVENLKRFDRLSDQMFERMDATIKNQLKSEQNAIERQFKLGQLNSMDQQRIIEYAKVIETQSKNVRDAITQYYSDMAIAGQTPEVPLESAVQSAMEKYGIPKKRRAIINRLQQLGVDFAGAEQDLADEDELGTRTDAKMNNLNL